MNGDPCLLPEYQPSGFALSVFRDRYAIHPEETFSQACMRVAEFVSGAEEGVKRDEFKKRFNEILVTNRFSPGGRIWRGSGRPRGQLLNCFVLPDDMDSREGWGNALRDVTIISGTGGGVGINFSRIRPRGSRIRGTGGEATGAVSLMKAINAVCDQLREGGGRRSALLFGLRYDHPDMPEFLRVKLDQKELSNANISVLIDDEFLKLLDDDEDIVFQWQTEERGKMKATELWKKIVENAWACGDPGILNIGLAQQMNNLAYLPGSEVICTNPCGEQPLPSYGSCCLGAIVLPTHVIDGEIDWDMLDDTIRMSVRFLDNVLDRNNYPFKRIEDVARNTRRIGLGVMGLHDLLLEMGLKYSSEKGLALIDEVMEFIKKRAYEASIFLAVEKGPFPQFDHDEFVKSGFVKRCLPASIRTKIREYGIRNCAILTLAPTGTTAIVAGVSSGVEPMFAPVYERRFNQHAQQHDQEREQGFEIVVHPLLAKFIAAKRSYAHFEGAHQIQPDIHCKVQEVCQKHIDAAVSKTINVPADASVDELSKVMRRYLRTLKGLTVYRDGSKGVSPLVPLPIESARMHLDNIAASVAECSNGTCSIGS